MEGVVRAHDPVTRNHNGRGVGPHRLTDRPGSPVPRSQGLGDGPVGRHMTGPNRPDVLLHLELEVREGAQIQGDVAEVLDSPAEVILQSLQSRPEVGRGITGDEALPGGREIRARAEIESSQATVRGPQLQSPDGGPWKVG